VSDYYKADEYKVSKDVEVTKYDGFTLYGDEKSEKGIIFYPGGLVEASAYEPIANLLAEDGICVAIVNMPFNLAVFGQDKGENIFDEIKDVEKWYIGGHSLGGAMAASFAANHSEDINGLILLGAYSTVKLPDDMKVLSIYGSKDLVMNRENYKKEKGNAKLFTEYVIEGGNHGYFGNYGMQKGDGKADITAKKQWELTADKILEWIKE
jgi:hypothetical protein